MDLIVCVSVGMSIITEDKFKYKKEEAAVIKTQTPDKTNILFTKGGQL